MTDFAKILEGLEVDGKTVQQFRVMAETFERVAKTAGSKHAYTCAISIEYLTSAADRIESLRSTLTESAKHGLHLQNEVSTLRDELAASRARVGNQRTMLKASNELVSKMARKIGRLKERLANPDWMQERDLKQLRECEAKIRNQRDEIGKLHREISETLISRDSYLKMKRAQDAENATLSARVAELEGALRVPVYLAENNPNAPGDELWLSWIAHPEGYKAARAALQEDR